MAIDIEQLTRIKEDTLRLSTLLFEDKSDVNVIDTDQMSTHVTANDLNIIKQAINQLAKNIDEINNYLLNEPQNTQSNNSSSVSVLDLYKENRNYITQTQLVVDGNFVNDSVVYLDDYYVRCKNIFVDGYKLSPNSPYNLISWNQFNETIRGYLKETNEYGNGRFTNIQPSTINDRQVKVISNTLSGDDTITYISANTSNSNGIIKIKPSRINNQVLKTDENGLVKWGTVNEAVSYTGSGVISTNNTSSIIGISPATTTGKILKTLSSAASGKYVGWSTDEGTEYTSGRFTTLGTNNAINNNLSGDNYITFISANNNNTSGKIIISAGTNDRNKILSTSDSGEATWITPNFASKTYGVVTNGGLSSQTGAHTDGGKDFAINTTWLNNSIVKYLTGLTHSSTNNTLKINSTNHNISWGEDTGGAGSNDGNNTYVPEDTSILFNPPEPYDNTSVQSIKVNPVWISNWIAGVGNSDYCCSEGPTAVGSAVLRMMAHDNYGGGIGSNSVKTNGTQILVNPTWVAGQVKNYLDTLANHSTAGYVLKVNSSGNDYEFGEGAGGSDGDHAYKYKAGNDKSLIFNSNTGYTYSSSQTANSVSVNAAWLSGGTSNKDGYNAITGAVKKYLSDLSGKADDYVLKINGDNEVYWGEDLKGAGSNVDVYRYKCDNQSLLFGSENPNGYTNIEVNPAWVANFIAGQTPGCCTAGPYSIGDAVLECANDSSWVTLFKQKLGI